MKKILVCDIETNNAQGDDGKPIFDFFKDDPIQIAYAVYGDRHPILTNELFLHTPSLRPEIEKFTGISRQTLQEQGFPHKHAAAIWKSTFKNHQIDAVVGHNIIAFDWVILTNWLLRTLAGDTFILPVVPVISDTMKRGSLLIYGQNGKWPKLMDLARHLGISVDEKKLHNALYDIDLCAKCHFALELKGY